MALNERNGKVIHDDGEKTNLDNVFAIGDVLDGKPELTPVAIQVRHDNYVDNIRLPWYSRYSIEHKFLLFIFSN